MAVYKDTGNAPKCIFIPSKEIFRKMIKVVVNREEHETQEEILARFSLIDYDGEKKND